MSIFERDIVSDVTTEISKNRQFSYFSTGKTPFLGLNADKSLTVPINQGGWWVYTVNGQDDGHWGALGVYELSLW